MTRRFWFSSVFLLSLTMANPVWGQIVPDPTANSAVLGNCQSSCDLNGGTVAGQNLFHSFEEFNIAPGASVYFSDPGVANIFSRVTGNSPSSIRGTLGISGGDANLFLLNPNGIIFGEGAALDLNGSFFATTADEIQFGDRSFAARPDLSEDLPLLTVDPGILWFNQSQNGSIVVDGAHLEVPARESITLLGKQVGDRPGILIKNSAIELVEGNVTLGAVGSNAEVKINNNLQLQFSPETVKGDIVLRKAAKISVGNLGAFEGNEVRIEARNLAIADSSIIDTSTTGKGKGADIEINASESVNITGENSGGFQQFLINNLSLGGNVRFAGSGLQTISSGTGNAGDIEISTPDLRLENGAGVISTTENSGASGNVDIVTDSFILNSSSLLSGSSTFSLGDVGQIKINTNFLSVEQGGFISSSTLGNGNAGNLTVNATDSIVVRETPAGSIIPTGIFTNTIFGAGQGGNLNLNTSRLMIQDGGQLSAASGAITGEGIIPLGGQGGNISIDAAETVEINGASAQGVFSSGILTDTRGSNPAGNLTINTDNLILRDRGFISASSIGTGMGGEIAINAKDSVELVGQGIDNVQQLFFSGLTGQLNSIFQGVISFTLFAGKGGNITINTSQLNLSSGAVLATATSGTDDAGNLKITASDRINIIGSAVAAPTFGAGDAGKIEIDTKNLSITQGGTIASASLGSGNGGDLFISATESLEVLNATSDLLFSSSVTTGSYRGLGSSGDLTLNTQRLSIKDGASIQANHTFLYSSDSDNAAIEPETLKDKGKVTINASESLEVSGSASQNSPFGTPTNSYIASTTTTSAPASDIQITTSNLSLYDSGAISVNSLGNGAAGTLDIVASNVTLENQGQLNGTTSSGRGGNINLQVDNIVRLENNSAIDTNAIASGDGGNIDLTANFIIASENSSISANAAAVGDGGNIDLTAKELFITDDSKITADADLGIDGTVEINTSIDNEQNNYTELPQKVVRAENTIVQSCGNGNGNQNVFSYTGRGGLPLNPLREFPTNNIVIADLEIPDDAIAEELEAEVMSEPEPIVEADRWKINAKGKVELVAANEPIASKFNPANCPFATYK